MSPRRSSLHDDFELDDDEEILIGAEARERDTWSRDDGQPQDFNTEPGKSPRSRPDAYVIGEAFQLTSHHKRDVTKGTRSFTVYAPASREVNRSTYNRLATPKVFLGSIIGSGVSFMTTLWALKNGLNPADAIPAAGVVICGAPYLFLRRAEGKGWAKHFYYEVKPYDHFVEELETNWKSILHQIQRCLDRVNNLILTSTDSDANHDELIQVREQISNIAWDAAIKTEKFLRNLRGTEGLDQTHFPKWLPNVYAKMVDSLQISEGLLNAVSEIEVRSEMWFHEESPSVASTQVDLAQRLSSLMNAQNVLESGDLPSTEDLNRTETKE